MKSKVDGRKAKAGQPWSAARGLWFLSSVLCFLTACNLPLPQAQPDATRNFLLTSTEIRPEASGPTTVKRWVVGVRAVDLAAYLHTRSMAIRTHANEIAFLDFARWGEPLDRGIARVLAEDLLTSGNVGRSFTPPFRADELRDFEVGVRVTACEGTAEGEVRFAAAWRVTAPGVTGGMVAEGNYVGAGLRWDGHDHGQLAARLSEALAGLSREIAAALPKDPPR